MIYTNNGTLISKRAIKVAEKIQREIDALYKELLERKTGSAVEIAALGQHLLAVVNNAITTALFKVR